MIEPSNEIARRAAGRLAGLDANLPAATERFLQAQGGPRRRGIDINASIAFASLLVSLVQFGWTVYQDNLRQKAKPEVREILVRHLRVRIEERGDGVVPAGERERIVEVVTEEILG